MFRLALAIGLGSLLFLGGAKQAHAVEPAGSVKIDGEEIPIPGLDHRTQETVPEVLPWESRVEERREAREAGIGERRVPPAPVLPPVPSAVTPPAPATPAAPPLHRAAPLGRGTLLPRTGVPLASLLAIGALLSLGMYAPQRKFRAESSHS